MTEAPCADGHGRGFRRRILIEPASACVTAELEDDYHRMVVTLRLRDGIAEAVEAEMKRWPWTTCRGAIARVQETFTGQPLAAFARRGERATNCTHLHDLAVFAAAHAGETAPVAYDVFVTDPVEDRRIAMLARNGAPLLRWKMHGLFFIAPAEIAGRTVLQLGDWISSLDRRDQEAARILRWASMLANGRQMDIPAHSTTDPFPLGTCYTFSEAIAPGARRRPGTDIDFSASSMAPLADRNDAF